MISAEFGAGRELGDSHRRHFEAPIEDQLVASEIIPIYSAMAAFHPTALDSFGRQTESKDWRRCPGSALFDEHRAVTLAYVTYWSFAAFIPFALETFDPLYKDQWNLDLDICENPAFDCTKHWWMKLST